MAHRSWLVLAGVVPATLAAQTWNAPPVEQLVARAIAARTAETDSSHARYRGLARGIVTFEVEVGPPESTVPRLLKADELVVEVYWESGKRSKQAIRSWRDTTLLPTGIQYHRDHLGIVTDDVGPRIRIGDGDEVRAVPHPLAPDGPAFYDYLAGDTLRVETASGRLVLVAVDVRPRDPELPLAVGRIYLDVGRAVLVRSELTFTPSAYRDADLEDIALSLERALVDGRHWLPFRQEIVIRRRSAVLDFPLRGVIRGRWTIDEYDALGDTVPDAAAAAIGGLRAPGGAPAWNGPLLGQVDSARRHADSDPAAIRSEASRLLRDQALDGLPRFLPRLSRLSDVLHVNRVQGLAVGAGARWRLAPALAVRGAIGVGTADGRITGRLGLSFGAIELEGEREVMDVSDVPAASGIVASLAAQEGGDDYGHFILRESIGLRWSPRLGSRTRLAVRAAREWAWSVGTEARPAFGSYGPNPPLGSPPAWVGRMTLEVGGPDETVSRRVGLHFEGGFTRTDWGRVLVEVEEGVAAAGGVLQGRALAGLATAGVPARRSFALGGRGTLLDEPFRAWGGSRMAWAMLEWLAEVRGPAIPLGRFGRTSPSIRLGPFLAAGWAGGAVPSAPWRPSPGIRPVAGLAVELIDRAIRVEIGQSLRRGFGPSVSIDVARAWWPVL